MVSEVSVVLVQSRVIVKKKKKNWGHVLASAQLQGAPLLHHGLCEWHRPKVVQNGAYASVLSSLIQAPQ